MKKLIALLLSVAMIAAFTSCSQSGGDDTSKDGSQVKVAGMVYLEDQFMRMMSAGYKAAANEAGANYREFNCNQDQAKETQTINTYVQDKIDGIAIAPLNQDSSIEAVKSAANAGVKVVLTDSTLTDGSFLVGGFTSDQKQLGASTGKAAKEFLEKTLGATKENPVEIAVVCFDSLLPEKSGARVDGFLGEVGDLVKVVDRQDAWEQDKAVTTVDGILTAHPNVKLIYAANDGGTVGSTMAIENKGLKDVYVFGIDASEQIASYLQNDKNVLQAVTGQDAYQMGYQSMQMLIKAIKGENTGNAGQVKTVDGILLTRTNPDGIKTYLDDLKKIG